MENFFNKKYPYSTYQELNLDWIIEKINEFDNRLDTFAVTLKEEIEADTKEYIDNYLADLVQQFEDFKTYVNNTLAQLDTQFEAFKKYVNNRVAITEAKVDAIQKRMDNLLPLANEYTNQAIIANNDYIIAQTTKSLKTATVFNYFTGKQVSIQDMFNYLASLHAELGITVAELVALSKTVTDIINYRASCTNIAMNGKNIFI